MAKITTAKYNGFCAICGQRHIRMGSRIVLTDEGWATIECYKVQQDEAEGIGYKPSHKTLERKKSLTTSRWTGMATKGVRYPSATAYYGGKSEDE